MSLNGMKNFCMAPTLSVLPAVLAVLFALSAAPVFAYSERSYSDPVIEEIAVSALPVQAAETLRRIRQGGPFFYARDGVVFGNFEKRLPRQQRGYYHEYTVKTPGVRNRGARRIVCGQAAECYYSNDHYETFRRIRE